MKILKFRQERVRALIGFFLIYLLRSFFSSDYVFAQETKVIDQLGVLSNQDLISLNFKETDIREVLNILAYKGGVNIVAGDDIMAKVTVQLQNVPWEQALEVILKTYNFTYKREGNLIRIISLQRAIEEEGKVPVETKIISLNFAKVEDLKQSLGKILSKRGTIETDKRTNSLIITDIPEVLVKIKEAAIRLDSQTPQVLIEAMMVDVVLTDEDRFGVFWNIAENSTGNTFNQNLTSGGNSSFDFYGVFGDININGLLDFWQHKNKAQILANPRVLTLDNQEAKIEIIEEIPYLETVDTGGGTTTNVKFRDAGIKLFVTPHITNEEFISMNVKPEQSFKADEVENQPVINTRRAETNLLIKDGQTIVIGGLRRTTDNVTHDKIPILGDIPIVGFFFKRKLITKTESELLLFVTPHIIKNPVLTDTEMHLYEELDKTKPIVIDERTEREKLTDWFKERKKKQRERKKADDLAKREAFQKRRIKAKDIKDAGVQEEIQSAIPVSVQIKEKTAALDEEQKRLKEALQKLQEGLKSQLQSIK